MSFFKRLWAKLFGKKKEQEAPRVAYTPTVERPPYATTGKFQPPEVTVPEMPRVRAITEELPPRPVVRTEVDGPPVGWPKHAYEFQPGVYYVPYDGSQGGPFSKPEEAWAWMEEVDRRNKNSKEGDAATAAQVHGGVFNARGGVNENEARMLYAANRLLHQKTEGRGGSIFYNHQILEGQVKDIANWINTGERLFNAIPGNADYNHAFVYSQAFPDIRPIMKDMVNYVVSQARRLS